MMYMSYLLYINYIILYYTYEYVICYTCTFFTFPPHQIHTQHNTNLYFIKNIKTLSSVNYACLLSPPTSSPLIFFFMLLILAHVHLLSHQIVHPFYVDKIDLKFFQVSFSMHLVGMYVITPMLCPNFQR